MHRRRTWRGVSPNIFAAFPCRSSRRITRRMTSTRSSSRVLNESSPIPPLWPSRRSQTGHFYLAERGHFHVASTPLAPEYLRAEVDRLAFGVRPAEVPVAPPLLMAVNTKTGPSGAPVVQGKREGIQPEDSEENSLELQAISEARQAGLETTDPRLAGRRS